MDQNFTNPTSTTTTTVTTVAPQGKGMGVAGFVISLVALVFWFVISPIALVAAVVGSGTGLAVAWVIVSALGLMLAAMGMSKLGKTGGKKGLAVTGVVLGIIALVLSAWTVYGVITVKDKAAHNPELQQSINDMKDSLKSMGN